MGKGNYKGRRLQNEIFLKKIMEFKTFGSRVGFFVGVDLSFHSQQGQTQVWLCCFLPVSPAEQQQRIGHIFGEKQHPEPHVKPRN